MTVTAVGHRVREQRFLEAGGRSVQRDGHPARVVTSAAGPVLAAMTAAATAGLLCRWAAADAPDRGRPELAQLRAGPFRWVGPLTAALIAGLLALPDPGLTEALVVGVLSGSGAVLTATDLRWHLLPDRVTGPCAAAVLVLAATHAAATDSAQPLAAAAVQAGTAAGVLLAVFVAVDIVLARPGGPGLGDVKLAGLLGGTLGAFTGGPGQPVGLPVQALQLLLLGEIFTVLLGLIQRARSGVWGSVPAGPGFLLAAAVIGAATR